MLEQSSPLWPSLKNTLESSIEIIEEEIEPNNCLSFIDSEGEKMVKKFQRSKTIYKQRKSTKITKFVQVKEWDNSKVIRKP